MCPQGLCELPLPCHVQVQPQWELTLSPRLPWDLLQVTGGDMTSAQGQGGHTAGMLRGFRPGQPLETKDAFPRLLLFISPIQSQVL